MRGLRFDFQDKKRENRVTESTNKNLEDHPKHRYSGYAEQFGYKREKRRQNLEKRVSSVQSSSFDA